MGGLINKNVFPAPTPSSYSQKNFNGIDRLCYIPSNSYVDNNV